MPLQPEGCSVFHQSFRAARHRSAFFFFNDTATTEIYTLSLHDALPISSARRPSTSRSPWMPDVSNTIRPLSCSDRSEEHTSELQSRLHLVCRLLLEKKHSERRKALSGRPS